MKGTGYVHDNWIGARPWSPAEPFIGTIRHSQKWPWLPRIPPIGAERRNENFDLDPYLPAPRDQTETSACVSFAFALHMWTQMHRILALTLPTGQNMLPKPDYVSEQWGYWLARALARSNPNDPLVDTGTTPGRFLQGVQDRGIVPQVIWPWNPALVNDEPTIAEAVAAMAYKVENYEYLGSGEVLVNGLVRACDELTGACVAIQVDGRSMENEGPEVLGLMDLGNLVGSHMVPIVGYRRGQGGLEFKIQNSWGWSWRLAGCAYLSERLVRSSQCFGACRVRVVPTWR